MKKIVKAELTILFIFVTLPILVLFLIVAGILNSSDDIRQVLPKIEEEKAQEYKAIVEGTPINWADMIVFDTIRYENDFEKADPDETVWEFLEVYYEKLSEGTTSSGKTEPIVVESGTLTNKDEILEFIYNTLEMKNIRTAKEAIHCFQKSKRVREHRSGGKHVTYVYAFKIQSKSLEEIMKDFSEGDKEWAQALVDENVVYEMFEGLVDIPDIPDHIIVEGEGFFAWPTPNLHTVTSPYGWRIHPKTGKRAFHSGVDISGANAQGQPVIAAASGVVIQTGSSATAGNNIRVKHIDKDGNEWQTRYLHLSKIKVSVGQQVNQGDVIGAVGNTGRSTGPHLHIEMKYKGQPVDPYLYIK